jgi:hypothetical protein
LNGGGSEGKPERSEDNASGGDQSRPGVPDGDGPVGSPGVDVPGSPASGGAPPDSGGAGSSDHPGLAGVEPGDTAAEDGEPPGGDAGSGRDVQPGAFGDLGNPLGPVVNPVPTNLTINLGEPIAQSQPGYELALRLADIQEQQLQFQRLMHQDELALRREAQRGELELRRFALERAADSDQATIERLERADARRWEFAHRGQTFAMWLAGASAFALLGGGLAVVFLTVAGTIAPAAGATLAGLLLAAGLITAVSNLVRNFLPGRSDDEISGNASRSIETKRDTDTGPDPA